ncbi:MAG: hypothetical protein ABSG10_12775, partial [Terracidiphilus sp.]
KIFPAAQSGGHMAAANIKREDAILDPLSHFARRKTQPIRAFPPKLRSLSFVSQVPDGTTASSRKAVRNLIKLSIILVRDRYDHPGWTPTNVSRGETHIAIWR